MSELSLARAGLLLIDVQREYFDEGRPLRIPDGPLVLARLRHLVESAREAHMPIIHVRHEEAPGAAVFDPEGPFVETMPELVPRGFEPIVTKHSPGSFTNTELKDVLTQFGVRRLVIAGFMTHMCCDTTARQAAEQGLDVIFLTDGTATRDLALPDRTVSHRDVQAATLAAQADGFSTLADVATVRNLLVEAAW
jgi:nicotinamidase-related amidase